MPQGFDGLSVVSFESRRSAEMATLIQNYGGTSIQAPSMREVALADQRDALAFAIWILRAFFAAIPREIEEAAAVDGCGRVRTLLSIVLPLARPALVTVTIFGFIAAWNEYIVALTLMTDPDKRPLTVGITSYVTAYVQHWNHLFAASVIAIAPVVVLFALIERHLVSGLTAGSVK